MNERAARPRTLAAIAAFKLAKALLLYSVGFGFLRLLNPAIEARLVHWAHSLAWSYDRGIMQKALSLITGMDANHLRLFGVGAFAAGILFTVEGIGLWLAKRWAEYLTLLATMSLLPVEVFELSRKFSIARVSALGLNVLIVIYLLIFVVRTRNVRPTSQELS